LLTVFMAERLARATIWQNARIEISPLLRTRWGLNCDAAKAGLYFRRSRPDRVYDAVKFTLVVAAGAQMKSRKGQVYGCARA
jgi:hypothetical protein